MRTSARRQRAQQDQHDHDQQDQIAALLAERAQLVAAREFSAALYDLSPAPYLVLDTMGTIKLANEAATALLGGTPSGLIGTPLVVFIARESFAALSEHLRRCHDTGVAVSEVVVAPRNGTRTIPAELQSRFLKGGGAARADRCLMTLRDVTLRKQLEAERRRMEEAEQIARDANKAKDAFIASLSHELRSPLTPALAAVTALQRGRLPSKHFAGLYETIRRNILAEVHLVDDLLDVTRIVSGKIRLDRDRVDLHQLAREAVESFQQDLQAKQLSVTMRLDAARHHLDGDAVRLRQVLVNLLKNAIKFTPVHGRMAVVSWNRGDALMVEVSDSGVGLAPEALERIFEPFEQEERGARDGGLGLGLAICKGIVALHCGTIDAHSAGIGRGSRFLVELRASPSPAAERGARLRADTASRPSAGARGSQVLLVEDHPDIADLLNMLLDAEGYSVRVARTAREALATDLDEIDVVLSDIGLPDMSGHELVRQLQEKREIPAVALSGSGTEADIRSSLQAGFAAHLTKPIEIGALLAALETAVASR